MHISVTCPECEASYRVGDDAAGKSIKCKKCGGRMSVPPGDPARTPKEERGLMLIECPGCQLAIGVPENAAGKKAECPKCGVVFAIPGAAEQTPEESPAEPVDEEASESKALQLVNWLIAKAIDGVPTLCSAEELAQEYISNPAYTHDGQRIDALISWETTKNFTSGFVAGLGGLITLPITLPAAFGASWIIQARMSAAIARISGHDLDSDQVRTFVVACLVGDALKDMAKAAGIQIGKGLATTLLRQLPGKVLFEINKKVGFRLITKAGQTGAINLVKGIPLVGGFVGGTFDGYACRVVGKTAKKVFYCADGEQ